MALRSTSALDKDQRTARFGVEMQHRHFSAIAAMIASMGKVHNQEHGFIDIREDVAEHFADELAATNPRFDRKRFLAACNV